MVRTHALSSDETVAIFTTPAASLFQDVRRKRNLQRQFLTRLQEALTSATPGAFVEKPFEGVATLKQFRAGDVMRAYCVFADELPAYNAFFVFQVTDHAYDRTPVVRYDAAAGRILNELRQLSTVVETEAYLREHDALDADDIGTIIEQI